MLGHDFNWTVPSTDINGLAEISEVDGANDYVVVYKNSAGGNRKVKAESFMPSYSVTA